MPRYTVTVRGRDIKVEVPDGTDEKGIISAALTAYPAQAGVLGAGADTFNEMARQGGAAPDASIITKLLSAARGAYTGAINEGIGDPGAAAVMRPVTETVNPVPGTAGQALVAGLGGPLIGRAVGPLNTVRQALTAVPAATGIGAGLGASGALVAGENPIMEAGKGAIATGLPMAVPAGRRVVNQFRGKTILEGPDIAAVSGAIREGGSDLPVGTGKEALYDATVGRAGDEAITAARKTRLDRFMELAPPKLNLPSMAPYTNGRTDVSPQEAVAMIRNLGEQAFVDGLVRSGANPAQISRDRAALGAEFLAFMRDSMTDRATAAAAAAAYRQGRQPSSAQINVDPQTMGPYPGRVEGKPTGTSTQLPQPKIDAKQALEDARKAREAASLYEQAQSSTSQDLKLRELFGDVSKRENTIAPRIFSAPGQYEAREMQNRLRAAGNELTPEMQQLLDAAAYRGAHPSGGTDMPGSVGVRLPLPGRWLPTLEIPRFPRFVGETPQLNVGTGGAGAPAIISLEGLMNAGQGQLRDAPTP